MSLRRRGWLGDCCCPIGRESFDDGLCCNNYSTLHYIIFGSWTFTLSRCNDRFCPFWYPNSPSCPSSCRFAQSWAQSIRWPHSQWRWLRRCSVWSRGRWVSSPCRAGWHARWLTRRTVCGVGRGWASILRTIWTERRKRTNLKNCFICPLSFGIFYQPISIPDRRCRMREGPLWGDRRIERTFCCLNTTRSTHRSRGVDGTESIARREGSDVDLLAIGWLLAWLVVNRWLLVERLL